MQFAHTSLYSRTTRNLDGRVLKSIIKPRPSFGYFTTVIKFMYSEKAAKFCEIFTLLLSYVVPVKSKVKILQNFPAFSEHMNFTSKI